MIIIILILLFFIVQIYFIYSKKENIKNIIRNKAENEILKLKNINNSKFNFIQDDTILHIKIQNGKIITIKESILKDRSEKVIEFLNEIIIKYKIKDSEFQIGLDDEYNNEYLDQSLFVFSKNRNENTKVLIPDLYAMQNYQGKMNEKDNIKFDKKINKSFFVGASTGELNPLLNKRLSFCNWTLDHLDISLCYITNIVQIPLEQIKITYPKSNQFIKNENISIKEQMKYKFIINLDGNTSAWDRLPWIFNSNCICLKEKSDNICWYYDLMEEGKQYLKFENYDEIPKLMEKRNEEYKKIIKNANQFVNDYLRKESHEYYMYYLITYWNKYILNID